MDETTIDPSLLDAIGPWSERKFGIVQDYSERYSIVLTNAKNNESRFEHHYIDGFASAGYNKRRGTGDLVKGTALNSLEIVPPFDHYHFVEINPDRHKELQRHVLHRDDVEVHLGDTNEILPKIVFPQYHWRSFHKAFCVLDPYTHKHLRWETIVAAADTKSIDLLLHFPTMPMNRGALHKAGVFNDDEAAEMTRFWGDTSWEAAAYERNGLFSEFAFKTGNDAFVRKFCERLKAAAGFRDTATPIPMKNTQGSTLYYLIFAGHHPTALEKMRETARFFVKFPTAQRRKNPPLLTERDTG